MLLLRIYLAGMAVLVAAIALNLMAGVWKLATWYTFLEAVSRQGLAPALRGLSAIEILSLAVLYPFLLGMAAYWVLSLSGSVLR